MVRAPFPAQGLGVGLWGVGLWGVGSHCSKARRDPGLRPPGHLGALAWGNQPAPSYLLPALILC